MSQWAVVSHKSVWATVSHMSEYAADSLCLCEHLSAICELLSAVCLSEHLSACACVSYCQLYVEYAADSLCLFELLSAMCLSESFLTRSPLKLRSHWPHCFEQTFALTAISLSLHSQSHRSRGQLMWSQCCRRSSTSSTSALPRTTYFKRSWTSFLSFWSRCLMHTSLLSQPSLQVSMKVVWLYKIVSTMTV